MEKNNFDSKAALRNRLLCEYVIPSDEQIHEDSPKMSEDDVIKAIKKDIDAENSSLQEASLINENVIDVLKKYWRTGVLTVAVAANLLASGYAKADQLQTAGMPKAQIELAIKDGGVGPETTHPTKGMQGDTQQVADSTLTQLLLPKENVKTSDGGKTYSYSVKTPSQATLHFSFSSRGGDKDFKGTVDFKNTKVESDSKEMEKKFQFIKDAVENLGQNISPEQFAKEFKGIKQEFEARFKDSELTLDGENILFTHRFLDDDNIAQANYLTTQGDIIAKGQHIPQDTKVVKILGAKGSKQEETNTKVEDKQAIAITNKKITIDKSKLSSKIQDRDKIAIKLKNKLEKDGFNVIYDGGDFIVVNETGFFIDAKDTGKTMDTLNQWAQKNFGVTNMFSFAGQQAAQAQAK